MKKTLQQFAPKSILLCIALISILWLCLPFSSLAHSNQDSDDSITFPRSQESYQDQDVPSSIDVIVGRAKQEPFNVIVTILFFLAITHSMLVSAIQKIAHKFEKNHQLLIEKGKRDKNSHSIGASLFHLISEVEVVFGLWSVALIICIAIYFNWDTAVYYVNSLHYTEPLFIIVIMCIASSRPIVKLFEVLLGKLVKLFGGTLEAWWICLLVLAPLLGSFITEPAAMTIGAMLLGDKFYSLNPSKKLKYVTLALLFVNVSIGGVLTNFAAPPVLMVASVWNWDTPFMFFHFGWKAILAIAISTTFYFIICKKDLRELKPAYQTHLYKRYIQKRFISKKELEDSFDQLEQLVDKNVAFTSELDAYSLILQENIKELAKEKLTPEECEKYDIENAITEKFNGIREEEFSRTIPGLLPKEKRPPFFDPNWDQRDASVPVWIMIVHLFFLLWTVLNAHEPVLFLAGFLFFLGFYQVTNDYQNRLDLKQPLLVAFFLAGLMIHGTLQSWWIGPLLQNMPELGLNITAIILTSFNDNASITYLSSLVPHFSDALKYAILTGAVTGGGLTVIANAPNPVGQSVLKKYFDSGISPVLLLKYAFMPTIITALIFYLFR